MMNLAIRNWRLYIRDRAVVLYSMLAVFIIIGLYVLFLGDNMVAWVADVENGRYLVDSWIMAGLIGVTSFTTTLGALGTIVEDRDRKINKDFSTAPLKRWQIAGGYLVSAVLIGFFMCCVTLVLAEGYILAKGGALLSPRALAAVLGIALVSVATSATMLFPLVLTVKSTNAYAGISTVTGTLIGFVTGMYIPIGEVPGAVQVIMKCFPTTHAVALLRQAMTEAPAALVFSGAPAEVAETFREEMGIILRFGNVTMPFWGHLLVLAATMIVFFSLSVWLVSRRKAR